MRLVSGGVALLLRVALLDSENHSLSTWALLGLGGLPAYGVIYIVLTADFL